MRSDTARIVLLVVSSLSLTAGAAFAQGFSAAAAKPQPWSRVAFFTNSARTSVDTGESRTFTELSTAFSYQLPDVDEPGADYGVDVRYTTSPGSSRPERVSIYEGFAGARLAAGAVRVRAGHVWLNDLGSLGSLAGGVFEVRQRRTEPDGGRLRLGAFGGLEPNILDTGYAPNVRKFGAYVGYDGANARRHSAGYVMVRNGPLTERSAVTTTNMLPLGRKLFVYQAAEYNIQQPVGMARRGFAYFLANVRATPNDRLELQGNYNRGRSIDARGLGDDLLSGRPIAQRSVDGWLYESFGGRATVEALPRVRVYGGYSIDRNNRDARATGRLLIGGYASNVRGSGLDITASDSLMHRPDGSYHSRYASVGHQFGRQVYASADVSTSLSVVRFSRSDGITIETRPHTTRFSGTATVYATRSASITATLERTTGDDVHEFRVMAGLSYRIR